MKETFVISQGHGESIPDSPFLQKILGVDTDGHFSLMEATMAPRELVIPHTHTREDEFTFVHRGEIGARVGEQEVTVEAGSFLFKPRGIPHAMWNPTDEPAILLEIISPSGFEQFFVEVSRIPGGFHPSNRARIDELAAKYGQRFHYDAEWLPEVIAKHHLQWG
ncbi:MAG TPA: cupin domain-containing protein [Ktedonobacteraceae bacterium]